MLWDTDKDGLVSTEALGRAFSRYDPAMIAAKHSQVLCNTSAVSDHLTVLDLCLLLDLTATS